MKSTEYNEVINFLNQLKAKGIPLIIEYKNNTPVKIFYKPPQSEWFGIAVLEEKERLHADQKYCGLLISEIGGIIVPGIYDVNINGSHWKTLRIEDFDIYVQNAINEVKNI